MSPESNYAGQNSTTLSQRYESVSFNAVHGRWLPRISKPGTRALDIGCGSGRDAAALADLGLFVTAVDSSADMLTQARRLHAAKAVQWLLDALPQLSNVRELGQRFDLILLSAVWMHLPPASHESAMATISKLSNEGGLVVISYRVPVDSSRGMYECDPRELNRLARKHRLQLTEQFQTEDALERPDVKWRFHVLRMK